MIEYLKKKYVASVLFDFEKRVGDCNDRHYLCMIESIKSKLEKLKTSMWKN